MMNSVVISAFVLGAAGSLHCLGMCGPLAIWVNNKTGGRISGALSYGLGRSTTYAAFGFLFGWLGDNINFSPIQKTASIIAGIFLIVYLLLSHTAARKWLHIKPSFISKITRKMMSQAIAKNRPAFVFGLINGLLPCGLVYLALATAILGGSALTASVAMFVFGLGTIPAMAFAPLLLSKFSNANRIKRVLPYLTFAVAVLLILRGSELGIPFISPEMSTVGDTPNCH